MPFRGLPALVVHHREQLVLPLLARVLCLTIHRQNIAGNDQVNGKLDLLHDLLLGVAVVHHPLQMEDQHGRQVFQAQRFGGVGQLARPGVAVALQHLGCKVGEQDLLQVVHVGRLDVELQCEEGLEGGRGLAVLGNYTGSSQA